MISTSCKILVYEANQTLIVKIRGKKFRKFRQTVIDFDSSGSESDTDTEFDNSCTIYHDLRRHSSFQ